MIYDKIFLQYFIFSFYGINTLITKKKKHKNRDKEHEIES